MREYSYNIINDVYNWMISGMKNIEVRILKEKSQAIKAGDIITFNNQENVGKFVKVKITNKTIVDNVYELTEKFEIERMMPGHSKEELIELMKNIYGEELNQKQIVAFEFEYLYCDSEVEVIEYNEQYLEDVRDLLVELEEYILSIDKDNLDQLHPEYREKKAILDLEEVNNYNGKCYLAIENGKAIGLIMGCIPPYDEYDYLDYKCPRRGEITELIVTNKTRSKGIGQKLINKMEEYFKSVGCEFIIVDVFAYNEIGKNFYSKNNYHTRGEIRIKKITE
ncbi:MAG: GNAT family N-acetyltransferase [Bacilli bacterium]|nr:GNAT family N-acetyltransferase [Bacilli bacterium]